MQAYLLAGPDGFSAAVDTLNTAAASAAANVFEQLVGAVFDFLQARQGVISVAEYQQKFATAGVDLTEQQMQSGVNAVEYICRGARQHCATPEALFTALQTRTEFVDAAAEAFTRRYEASAADVAKEAALTVGGARGMTNAAGASWKGLSMGQFVSMDWKIGLAVSSTHCENLNSPYISLLLKVAHRDGHTTQHPFELSVPEFMEFRKVFKSVGKVLEGM